MTRENVFGFDLRDVEKRQRLRPRYPPYWQVTAYGRAVGYQRYPSGHTYWVTRIRLTDTSYRHHRLGPTEDNADIGELGLSFEDACAEAGRWLATSPLKKRATEAKPIGSAEHLFASPIGEVFTVGHALTDYIEWKRLIAARSHFLTLIILINYHMVPRVFSIPASEFNGERLRYFVRDVLETPPKVPGQPQKPRRPIEHMTEEQLRKRKKTLNTLISILRCALRMAWENGRFDSDRAWRCLRNVPNVDRLRILHLNRPECHRLLACCAPDLKRLVLAALYTGCRITEFLRLRAEDVGWDHPSVYIRPLKTYRERYVMLPDEGVTFFRDLAKDLVPDAPLLVRDSGLGWKGTHKYRFKLAVRDASLPQAFCFHSLRHTYASQLVGAGAPLIVVSEQLGHANIETVSRTYSHLSPMQRLSEVQNRFEGLVVE